MKKQVSNRKIKSLQSAARSKANRLKLKHLIENPPPSLFAIRQTGKTRTTGMRMLNIEYRYNLYNQVRVKCNHTLTKKYIGHTLKSIDRI